MLKPINDPPASSLTVSHCNYTKEQFSVLSKDKLSYYLHYIHTIDTHTHLP